MKMNYQKRTANFGTVYPLLAVFRQNGMKLPERSLFYRHTTVEIACVLAGESVCKTEQKEYKISQGDVLMFSPGEKHQITPNEELKLLIIHFEPRFIWNMGGDFPESSLLNIFFFKNEKFENLIEKTNPVAPRVHKILLAAEKELIRKDQEYVLAVKMYIVQILLLILRNFDYTARIIHSASRGYTLDGMETALDYIHKFTREAKELDELAEKAELSRSHFCTVFKKYNGISPWDYITIRRIEKAVHLMRTTKLAHGRIAEKCGFNNKANFYRACRKVTDYVSKT